MERLTERIGTGQVYTPYCDNAGCDENCTWCDFGDKILEKLAEYEDAEEQGLLLRLPVPEGTIVYQLGYTLDCKFDYKCPLHEDGFNACVMGFACENEEIEWKVKETTFYWKMLKSVGSTIFLTKEEAEQALAKMKEV